MPPGARPCNSLSTTRSRGIWPVQLQSNELCKTFIGSKRERDISMRNKTFGDRIADVLIEDGLLLPNQLEEATQIQKEKGGRLLKILTDKQFVTDQDMAFSMGRCLNVSPVNVARIRIPEDILGLIPRDMAKANKLVPVARLNGKLFVAMADPTNVLAVD